MKTVFYIAMLLLLMCSCKSASFRQKRYTHFDTHVHKQKNAVEAPAREQEIPAEALAKEDIEIISPKALTVAGGIEKVARSGENEGEKKKEEGTPVTKAENKKHPAAPKQVFNAFSKASSNATGAISSQQQHLSSSVQKMKSSAAEPYGMWEPLMGIFKAIGILLFIAFVVALLIDSARNNSGSSNIIKKTP